MWHHNDTPLGHGLAAPFRNALLVAVVLALPGAAAAQSVQAVVDASQPQYQPGETLRIAVSLASPGVPALADVFVVLQLPGSTQVVSLGLGTAPVFGTLTALQGLVPAARGVNLAGAFSVGVDPFFTYAFTGGEPLGPYVLHMAVVRAGALADGQIGAGEMLAYATDGFTLERPLVEVLQPAARSEVIIAPQGGDVQTTAANGTGITLTMPPGALAEEAAIAITPVTTIANLPVSGTLLAAVRLELFRLAGHRERQYRDIAGEPLQHRRVGVGHRSGLHRPGNAAGRCAAAEPAGDPGRRPCRTAGGLGRSLRDRAL
jgi:hypothetical protein